MKITKLLAATSILAMTATSAQALDIVNGSLANPVTGFLSPLANELCLSDAAVTVDGTLSHTIELTSGGNFPQNLRIDVTLPAGVTFDGALSGGDVSARVTNTQASLQSGGADGDSTARFILSETNASGDGIFFDLPVTVSDCPDGSGVEYVVFDTQNNLFVEGDAVVNSNEVSTPMNMIPSVLPGCEDGVVGELLADDPEKEILLAATSGSGVDYDTLGDNIVGSYEYTIDTGVAVDAIGTPITVGDIDGIDWAVTVAEDEELASASSTAGGTDAFSSAGVAAVNADNFNDGVAEDISIDETGADPIANTTVSLTTSVDYTAASGLEDKTPDTAAMDALNREGVVFGTFDWVGSGNGNGTLTVLRVTGLETDAPTPYTVELSNTPNGTYDGTYSGTIPAGNDGELALVSANLFGVDAPVDFVRGDVQICFETTQTMVDVDRLMVRQGIVTAFNDGANSFDFNSDGLVPSTDADN